MHCVSLARSALTVAQSGWKHFIQLRPYSTKMSSIVNAHIQVLGTGASELAPCFYLFTDSKRYLFNCGENLQRFRTEFRPPLTVTSVFVTHVSWQNLGGFPGTAMTCRDQGVASISLHGPELLEEMAELTRFFVGRKKINLEVLTSRTEGSKVVQPVYSDENVRIETVPLSSHDTSLGVWSGNEGSSDDEKTSSPKPKRRKIIRSNLNNTTAFVCKLSDVRGKFDVGKAKTMGIPPSPLYKKLQNGESVTSADGRVVYSHEVMGPPKIGPVMIVIECPDESYIPSVASNPSLSSETFKAANQNVALIVHMSPASVLRNKTFQEWMSSFGPSTNHLILNKEMCTAEYGLRRFLKIQSSLHLMNPSVYHPLVGTPSSTRTGSEFDTTLTDSIVYGRTQLKYHLKPAAKMGADDSSSLKPLAEEYKEHFREIASNKALVNTIQCCRPKASVKLDSEQELERTVSSIVTAPLVPKVEDGNPVITFLGTGSATPTCYRNVTGILVQTARSGNMLLDCGEGSLSQIYRCFGKSAGDEIIRNISGVFISHIHGDHHLGLVGVLQRREELIGARGQDSPLILAPRVYLSWLRRYSRDCQRLHYRSVKCEDRENNTQSRADVQHLSFQTVPVLHCASAYGVLMKHSSGWSIVYSGDTRPCPQLVEAGKGATVLIHEATFEDSMIEDAKAKMHCTIGEALKVSAEMSSKFTLMTHFSSRYPRIPSVLMDSRIHSGVGIAVDCMSVCLKELNTLHADLPAMKEIFTHVIGTEDKDQQEQTVTVQDWGDEEASVSVGQ